MNNEQTNKYGGKFWNERYSSYEWVYGTAPNKFFKAELDKLNPGKILLIGEGEGRNAVYAALSGWQVDAVDFSTVAKEKALKLAEQNSVSINYEIADLSDYQMKMEKYNAVAIIFAHLNKNIRDRIHSDICKALKPKGTVISEVFAKEQLGRASGGPQNTDMLYSTEELRKEFKELNIKYLNKIIINLNESEHHEGEAVVVRMVAEKN